MRDPAGAVYRTREEVEREKLRDPIVRFTDLGLEGELLTSDDVEGIRRKVEEQVNEAVAFADASPEPPADWLMTDVFKE
jgi:TPP-dependent pyruvate/acetoin dehydrogenase alpha subunit